MESWSFGRHASDEVVRSQKLCYYIFWEIINIIDLTNLTGRGTMIDYALGMRTIIRDEEWMVKK